MRIGILGGLQLLAQRKEARYTEPLALLVAQLAYEGDRGAALAYRFEWFEERNA